MDNALTVVWLLGVGIYLGVKGRELWQGARRLEHQARATATHGVQREQARLNMALCSCEECRPPYWQESPAESQ